MRWEEFGFTLFSNTRACSLQDMCQRLYNDHNFFAVCRQLFRPSDDFGLLKGLPRHVQAAHPQLKRLQKDCYHPRPSGLNRTEAAARLIELYSRILAS